ncbi:hypothetical protein KXW25_002641 [Aspergillus fumigatus]|nr:hypothetical protein KXV32_005604 [Aspergillus fumigatus]KAH2911204.1 hypothetical protein KXW25_002641 [Aspergillus fumigatus]
MGFASKIANAQNNTQKMSGGYSGAPPAGYTGGPPASLQPGAGGYQQQQQQYQAYPGAPSPSTPSNPTPSIIMSQPLYNQQAYPPQLRPGSAQPQSPYPTSTPPPQQQQYQPYNAPSVPPNKPAPSPSPAPTSHSPYPSAQAPAPQGYPQTPYSPHPQSQGYPQASPYGSGPSYGQGQPQQSYGRTAPPPPQAQPYGQPYSPQQQAYGQPYAPQGAPYQGGPGGPPGAPGQAGYGYPGGAPPPARATEQQIGAYKQLLIGTIQEKNLQTFYPPDKLDRLVHSLANEAPAKIDRLVHEWSVPQEVAMDVMKLALFDVILYVDDSGSMEFEEKGMRKEQLRQILGIVATGASTFDQDGISVRFMNSNEVGDGIRSVDDVNMLVSRVRFAGLTPLGTSLRNKVIEPMVVGPARAGRLQKPVLIITITDGQPAGEPHDTVANTIRYASEEVSRTQYGRGAVSFQFSQVGTDTKAREFLASLDEDPQIGGLIDCTSNFEVEQDEMARANPPIHLTRELWCAKLMLGAIDSSYDTKDEKASGRPSGPGGPGGPPPPGPPGQYGGYNPGQNYGQQPGYYNQPPPSAYNQPGAYGQGQGYNQAPYAQSQGGPPQPGYGQTYGGYGAPPSDPYGRPPSGPPPGGYPPQQRPPYGQPPPPPRY